MNRSLHPSWALEPFQVAWDMILGFDGAGDVAPQSTLPGVTVVHAGLGSYLLTLRDGDFPGRGNLQATPGHVVPGTLRHVMLRPNVPGSIFIELYDAAGLPVDGDPTTFLLLLVTGHNSSLTPPQ